MVRSVLLGAALLLVVALTIVYVPDLAALLSDPDGLRSAIQALGPWGPVGLIALMVLQTVAAPLPGYLVQGAGGYLFGAWLGSVYGIIGLALGAVAAFLLGRALGRPLLEHLVPRRFLDGWAHLRGLNSMTAWVVILLLPVGDFCYFLAGLTSLSLGRMLLATILVRGPTVVVAAFVGAQVAELPSALIGLLVAAAAIIAVAGFMLKDKLEMLVFERILVKVVGRDDEQHNESADQHP